MDEAEHGLHDLLLDRLTSDPAIGEQALGLVLAAWQGDDDLEAALAGSPTDAANPSTLTRRAQQPEAYLAAVHVTGFRGVGGRTTLPLRPGPGLTLVTGRNGSGKSSFAEAAEVTLTGTCGRWSNRTAVWRDGWRNLHCSDETVAEVDLVTAGASGSTRLSRRWAYSDEPDGGEWTRQLPGQKRESFDGSEWGQDMVTYRPFLSHNELGALIDGKPSELHDALKRLLGLEPLIAAQDRLTNARKRLADAARLAADGKRRLCAELSEIADERAQRARDLLLRSTPDLAAIADLAMGDDDDASAIAALRELVSLSPPDPQVVAGAIASVRDAQDVQSDAASAQVRTAYETAALLRAAIAYHGSHGDGPCPVCATGTLDGQWRLGARAQAAQLEVAARQLRDANAELDNAVHCVRGLATAVPSQLRKPVPVDISPARVAWEAWVEAARVPQPAALVLSLESALENLTGTLNELRDAVTAELARRDEIWAPIARQLLSWHDNAENVMAAAPLFAATKQAETWLNVASNALRDERLRPFAESSQRIWQQLSQQSNVTLGPVRLDGAKTRRRAAMTVSVDGTDGGTALGVMSQGELHALALSLFLPRATVDQSPFRFVLIDDPVQAMDPAKVDGLARVLADVAKERQVIVFTHDTRLADSIRRLDLPATVWEVHRGERSVVTVHPSGDPISRYLDDARAVALTDKLPMDLRSELVVSFCRSAIEAACHDKVRSVRLARGERHIDVEALLAKAAKTHQKATLAVFDDSRRDADLLGRLKREGSWAIDSFQTCRQGVHLGYSGDLRRLILDVDRLAAWFKK